MPQRSGAAPRNGGSMRLGSIFNHMQLVFFSPPYEDARTYGVGFQHKASAQVTWGVEYRRIETKYLIAGDKDVHHLNVGFTFTF